MGASGVRSKRLTDKKNTMQITSIFKGLGTIIIALALTAFVLGPTTSGAAEETVTLLFTNDVESVYDPIEAFWLDDMKMIGGIAEMTTLINELRQNEPNVFLFDSGDIFTGALAKLTQGELAFELMITMGYDAMAIGNHEFEYGHKVFAWQKNRAPFPVLGANFFYKDTNIPYAQAHAIIERNGIRIGVIGIMGQDAVTAIIPSFIAPLDVTDPVKAVQKSIDELHEEVDLIVLLTHQGKTAPMQTDAESNPRLQRDIDADIFLAGAVEGADVLFAGHADAGTPTAIVHPKTGTLIMQTYGQATHLGYLQITLDEQTKEITSHDSKLIPVDPSKWGPDQRITKKLEHYRSQYPDLFKVIGKTEAVFARRYIEESDVGNIFTDASVEATGADMAFIHSGGLRKDIPSGEVKRVDILDVHPFVSTVILKRMSGDQIRRAIEQSLTLERGLLQVSGLQIHYDLSRSEGNRIILLKHKGQTLDPNKVYSVAAPSFLAEGGDLYTSFAESKPVKTFGQVSDIMIDYFGQRNSVAIPKRGRQLDHSK